MVLFVFLRGALEFQLCQDLKNPWNDNKPVKISRDGQVCVCMCVGMYVWVWGCVCVRGV